MAGFFGGSDVCVHFGGSKICDFQGLLDLPWIRYRLVCYWGHEVSVSFHLV